MWQLQFDHVSHHEIIKTTLAMGVPPVLIAAWIREYRNSETLVKPDDIVAMGIRRTRSVPQGDPSAANLFGAALDTPAARFCDTCQNKKLGLLVGNGYLRLLLLADNCWTIAMSLELQTVARAWNELLKSSKLQVDWGEAVWCSTAQDSLGRDHSTNTRRRVQSTGWITFDGRFTKELAEHEVSAWRRFYPLRQMLCDNSVALKDRLRLLASCVVSSMYWCAGSWILTLTQCDHLRTV